MSDSRFADGLRYRIEIPSVEGPAVLRAVLEEAEVREVPVRRVSQGSGVMMLTDDEIAELAQLGAQHGVEVSLFIGPRGAWDTGGQSAGKHDRGAAKGFPHDAPAAGAERNAEAQIARAIGDG